MLRRIKTLETMQQKATARKGTRPRQLMGTRSKEAVGRFNFLRNSFKAFSFPTMAGLAYVGLTTCSKNIADDIERTICKCSVDRIFL